MRYLKATAWAVLHPLDWLEALSDRAVAASAPRWRMYTARLLIVFGIIVVLIGVLVFGIAGQNPALPGISEMVRAASAAAAIAGVLCILRVAPDVAATIFLGLAGGSFALALVTLSVTLPTAKTDPFTTLRLTFVLATQALCFIALRGGFRAKASATTVEHHALSATPAD